MQTSKKGKRQDSTKGRTTRGKGASKGRRKEEVQEQVITEEGLRKG